MELKVSDKENFVREGKSSPRTRDQASECDISIPGLNRLFNASRGKISKMIWLMSMLACACFCVYFTSDRLQNYFDYPTATKTHVESKQNIQFPPFSICLLNPFCYVDIICDEMRKRGYEKSYDDCWLETNVSLEEWNISTSESWKNCEFMSVDVTIASVRNKSRTSNSNVITTMMYSAYGTCATITHVEKVPFLSISTSLKIILKNKYKPELIFIPHALPADKINKYELYNHNVEIFESGNRIQFKIHEQVYIYKNVTGRECYASDLERNRIYHYVSSRVDRNVCKLPILEENIRQCQTLSDVVQTFDEIIATHVSMLDDENWALRRICNRTAYAISVDFLTPNLDESDENDTENVTTTEVLIKFPDGTKIVVSEYFSYTLPALISDLFAYWGFFLCLSAPVFFEIFEFMVITLYRFYLRYVSNNKKQEA